MPNDATADPGAASGEEHELLPLRMLTELVYCPRLFHFMHVQGVMRHSEDTVEGTIQHKRAAARTHAAVVEPDDSGPGWSVPRSLALAADSWDIAGRLDAVVNETGTALPVEFKHGSAPEPDREIEWEGVALPGGAWAGDQVQLVGQMVLLESNGVPVSAGELYYRESRSRVRLELTQEARELLRAVVGRAREVEKGPLPPPLVDSPKCVRCSLAPICLPDEMRLLRDHAGEPRRLFPARADAGVLYVHTQGASVGKDGDALEVRKDGTVIARVPLRELTHAVLFGNVGISTRALHALMEAGRGVSYCTWPGRFLGATMPFAPQNVLLRREQFRRFSLPELCLPVARRLVVAKIRNQRTLLRRNARRPVDAALAIMSRAAKAAARAESLATLMGHEGEAGRAYFGDWSAMLEDVELARAMDGRSRRPPRDPVNAALSFAYALLLRDCVAATAGVGLDPMFGALHAVRPGRPALALDVMEPFRALVADSAVLRALNVGMVKATDFDSTDAGVALSAKGRKGIITAYERRVQEMLTHPVFQYRLSYRRLIEIEVRMVARWLEGELTRWHPYVWR